MVSNTPKNGEKRGFFTPKNPPSAQVDFEKISKENNRILVNINYLFWKQNETF
jgi:hypothetical protein